MICEYCGKTFKTAKGFEKHHCKKMDEIELYSNDSYDLYKLYRKVYMVKESKKLNEIELKMKFVKSFIFKSIVKLNNFLKENAIENYEYYLKFLNEKRIPVSDWTSNLTLKNFINYRAYNEDYATAVLRSENYLKSRNLDINTCTPNRIIELLEDGWISRHYFDYKKIDLKKIIPEEIRKNMWGVLYELANS